MFRSALRVSRIDAKNPTADQSPVIAVSLRKESPQGAQAADWIESMILGCSLLYPHSRLVLDLAQARPDDRELFGAVERHRSQVEARGGSLRIDLPSTARHGY